jgi:hypothetical protein
MAMGPLLWTWQDWPTSCEARITASSTCKRCRPAWRNHLTSGSPILKRAPSALFLIALICLSRRQGHVHGSSSLRNRRPKPARRSAPRAVSRISDYHQSATSQCSVLACLFTSIDLRGVLTCTRGTFTSIGSPSCADVGDWERCFHRRELVKLLRHEPR